MVTQLVNDDAAHVSGTRGHTLCSRPAESTAYVWLHVRRFLLVWGGNGPLSF